MTNVRGLFAGKRAEQYVIDNLLKLGAMVYVPVLDAEGVDMVVRSGTSEFVEVQVKSAGGAGGKDPRWFQVTRLRPRDSLYIVGVSFEGDDPAEAWILPSRAFDRFATGAPTPTRDLNLDTSRDGEPLREWLKVYRERWGLINEYSKYKSIAADPKSLQVRLALG